MPKPYRSTHVALGLAALVAAVAGLASAQSPPPFMLVVVEISPRAAVDAGAEWFWSPTDDPTKLQGPYLSGTAALVTVPKIRITPRQLAGPCVAPPAIDIEIKDGAGYAALAYTGANCI